MSHTSENIDYRSLLEKAFLELRQMRSELEAIEQAKIEPIAIIGMGCRFPGGANTPDQFWQLLHDGVDTITEIPASRWNVDAYYDPNPEVPGKMYTRYGAFLEDVDKFDPQFFGIAPREALGMDPQQRLLLEVSWEALENAGLVPEQLSGSKAGVFMGLFMGDYSLSSLYTCEPRAIDAHRGLGSMRSMAAGRLAYALDLQGPAIQLDTACSSALLAVHQACQSLRTKECNLALAGGVNLMFSPENTIALSKMQAISADGRCKTFDANADGYGRGEGCGVVVLKRLSDAITDNDNILATIRGSSVNHDGHSNGLSAPNGVAQEMVIREALENAQVSADQIQYVETHGTGTSLGDPIEVLALNAVLGKGRHNDESLVIGSVKTNLGHLEPASGIAGLIKVVLSLQQAQIPPNLHFKEPSPYIPWDKLPMVVPTQVTVWPHQEGGRKAGVSSFGMSGTNVHVIVAEAPVSDKNEKTIEPVKRPLHLLSLSAKSEPALRALANRYEAFLANHPKALVEDICFTANTGRSHFEHRLAVMGDSMGLLQEQLSAFAQNKTVTGVVSGQVNKPPKIAFLFTGQGSQSVGMGQQLYETQPTFRQALDHCDNILRDYLETPLLEILYPKDQELPVDYSQLNETIYTQPVLFALEYALAKLWQSWGIVPNVVMGHSIGEYVAACIAGVFSLEDGLKLITARGRLMQTLCEKGDMLVLSVDEAKATEIIQPYTLDVSIAAINGSENIVISGKHDAIEIIMAALNAKGIKTKRLLVSHAFHSPLMEPMLTEFERVASEVTYATPKIPLCSNVTGQLAADEITTPAYWCRHIRKPVRFAASMETLYQQGYELFMEIGPKPSLLGMARQCLPENVGIWLPSLRPGWDDWQVLLQSLGELYVNGSVIDWFGFDKDYPQCKKIPLPTYPFQRQSYWVEKTSAKNYLVNPADMVHPLLGQQLFLAGSKEIRFEVHIGPHSPSWLAHHRVHHAIVMPGAAYLEMALAAGVEVLKTDNLILKEVAIERALILSEEETTTMQLLLSPYAAGEYDFQIFSQSLEERKWIVHASGKVLSANQLVPSEKDNELIAKLQTRCAESVSVEEHYQNCKTNGLHYTADFQAVQQLWKGDGETLGQVQLPTLSADYVLHPALLDGCFQTAMVAFPVSSGNVYMPIGLDELHIYRRAGASLWSYTQFTHAIHQTTDTLTEDLHLFDESGATVVKIKGISAKRVSIETLYRSLQQNANELYEMSWQVAPRQPQTDIMLGEKGQWVVFTDSNGIGNSLAERLRTAGEQCVLVSPGPVYLKKATNHYQINPLDFHDFQHLQQEFNAKPALRGIIYLWGMMDKNSDPAQAAVEHCESLLYLLQTITQLQTVPRLWLLTQNSQAVSKSDNLKIQQSPLWGMARVIDMEHPELHCVCLDLDSKMTADEVQPIFEEIQSPANDNQLAWRKGIRYTARLTKMKNVKTSADKLKSIRSDGSYLITGGLGGLGLKTAQWMVAQEARHLVLIGRSKPSPQAEEILQSLRQSGAQIQVLQADVSIKEDIAKVLANINANMPVLKGIIHAAGVLNVSVLQQQTPDSFKQVMAPKIAGSWYLHQLTENMPLDFFVCFSSFSTFLGSMGQGNYAAANAFMDALAHFRSARGLPALSINWGPWAEVGMVATQTKNVQNYIADEEGTYSISPDIGMRIFGDLLVGRHNQVGILSIDWSKYLQQFAVGDEPPLFSEFVAQAQKQTSSNIGLELLQQLKAASRNESAEILLKYLQEIAGEILKLSITDIYRPLIAMGLDSLMAVELRNRLKNELNVTIPVVKFLENASIESLAEQVAEQWQKMLSATSTDTPNQLKNEIFVKGRL